MIKAGTIWSMFLALVSVTTVCRSLLPTDDTRTLNQWQNFDEAQASFDKIVAHQTTAEELFKMGWNPKTTANVKILTYLDLIQMFLPNASITMADLHPDVRACIESKDACRAYELILDVSHSKRHGNLVLDVLSFKKNTTTTGWNFKALVIVKDDMVAYKIRSGEPLVTRNVQSVKPLGPFQELDSLVRSVAHP